MDPLLTTNKSTLRQLNTSSLLVLFGGLFCVSFASEISSSAWTGRRVFGTRGSLCPGIVQKPAYSRSTLQRDPTGWCCEHQGGQPLWSSRSRPAQGRLSLRSTRTPRESRDWSVAPGPWLAGGRCGRWRVSEHQGPKGACLGPATCCAPHVPVPPSVGTTVFVRNQ